MGEKTGAMYFMGEGDKLNGSNFQIWKIRMQVILELADVWDVVEQEVGEASATAHEGEVAQTGSPIVPISGAMSVRKNRKAISMIKLCVTDPLLPLVHSHKYASEAWVTLKTLYGKPSKSRILNLQQKLLNCKLGDIERMASFLARINMYKTELKEAGKIMLDDDLVPMILNGLPKAYHTMRTTFMSLSSPLTYELLTDYLLQEEALQDSYGKGSSQGEALVASSSSKALAAGGMERKACSICGKTNHLEKKCWRKGKKNPGSSMATSTPATSGLCLYCTKLGHTEKECRIKAAASALRASMLNEQANPALHTDSEDLAL